MGYHYIGLNMNEWVFCDGVCVVFMMMKPNAIATNQGINYVYELQLDSTWLRHTSFTCVGGVVSATECSTFFK